MSFGTGDPPGQHPGLSIRDGIAVFGMYLRQGAQSGTRFKYLQHLTIGDHKDALVGHETLEGRYSMFFY